MYEILCGNLYMYPQLQKDGSPWQAFLLGLAYRQAPLKLACPVLSRVFYGINYDLGMRFRIQGSHGWRTHCLIFLCRLNEQLVHESVAKYTISIAFSHNKLSAFQIAMPAENGILGKLRFLGPFLQTQECSLSSMRSSAQEIVPSASFSFVALFHCSLQSSCLHLVFNQ